MLFRFRKKVAPKLLPANPGKGTAGVVAFANAQKRWNERYDFIVLLVSILRKRQCVVQREKSWLELKDSSFVLVPQLVDLQPLNNGGVRTATTIQIHHPNLVPEGVFEYQYATGSNTKESFSKGFEMWTQTDLPALLDALLQKPKTSTTFDMTFPEVDGKPSLRRRAILGPVMHCAVTSKFLYRNRFHQAREPATAKNAKTTNSAPAVCSQNPSRPSKNCWKAADSTACVCLPPATRTERHKPTAA